MHTSNMDVESSLKPPVASTMTLQHHSGKDLAPKTRPFTPSQASLKHFAYIQYGCGIQSEACCSLNHDITRTSPGLRSGPNTPKSIPHLVDPCVHSHHIKVPKHFVYIQYGCGIQSEDCCSLNNDITISHQLRSTLKPQNPTRPAEAYQGQGK